MKWKLIKKFFDGWTHYYLKNADNVTIGTTNQVLRKQNNLKELSLKNCQSLERGYDLDELVHKFIGYNKESYNHVDEREHEAFILGFKKALEILGDKKFSEEDILIAMTCMFGQEVFYETTHEETVKSRERYIENYIKHLQQSEWEVIVEMEYIGECNGNNNDGCFQDSPGHDCGCFKRESKLDSDGCLILKRI
jgi:hypothetical protein